MKDQHVVTHCGRRLVRLPHQLAGGGSDGVWLGDSREWHSDAWAQALRWEPAGRAGHRPGWLVLADAGHGQAQSRGQGVS